MKKFLMLSCVLIVNHLYGQNINQNINQNVNQNTIVINNQPIIEKKEYIIKYRPVYIEKPQPKRYARKLSSPICLLNYLWIYPEDLGSYVGGPSEIISQINRQGQYGRNTWRVPTDDELRLMENYADKCGLGDDIYLSTSHSNGILRLVSTGPSVQEQNNEKQARAKAIQEQRLQEEKLRAAQAAAQKEAQEAAHQASINNQNHIISSGNGFNVYGLIWASCNIGANSPYDKGVAKQSYSSQGNWRLPTEDEFRRLLKQSTKYDNYFRHPTGLIIPFGVYAVNGNGGNNYIMLPNMIVSSGSVPKFIRMVQNQIY